MSIQPGQPVSAPAPVSIPALAPDMRLGQVSSSRLLSPELLYEDVFAVWEVIWAARHISSEHFVLFIALALVEAYREVIRDNNMDFTDIIKFFNGTSCSSHPGCPEQGCGGPHLCPAHSWRVLRNSGGPSPKAGMSRI